MNIRTILQNRAQGFLDVLHFDNAVQLVLARLFFRTSLEVYVFRGLRIVVDHRGGDAAGTRAVLATSMYRRFLKYLPKAEICTILDLGANGGGFPCLLVANGYHLKKVVCVEMNPNTFRRLQFNIQTNLPLANPVCLNQAVAATAGMAQLHFGEGSTGESLYEAKGEDVTSKPSYPIKLTTLGELVEDQFGVHEIDLCKIDIEGAEYDVLTDSSKEALKRCRNLIIEIHRSRDATPKDILDRLREFGFQRISGDTTELGVHLFRRVLDA